MNQDVIAKFKELEDRKVALDTRKARLQAAQEFAQKELAASEEQLRVLGIDPANADATVSTLETQLATELSSVEQAITQAEQQLTSIGY